MPRKTQKPTEEKKTSENEIVLRRVAKAKEFSKDFHDEIVRNRKLYDGDHYQGNPKAGETRFVDPTFMNTVDLAVGIFQSNEMVWKAIGWKPSNQEQEKTSAVEKYLTALLDIASQRNGYDITYENYLQFTRDGISALYTVWDTEKAAQSLTSETYVDEKGMSQSKACYSEPPIHVEVLDPLELFVLPGGPDRWLCAMRITKMSLYDAEQTAGKYSTRSASLTPTQRMDTQVDLIDYWEVGFDEEIEEGLNPDSVLDAIPTRNVKAIHNAVLIDYEIVKPLTTMEGYTELPFDLGFYKPASRTDAKKWHSIITPMKDTVALVEKGINRRQRMIDFFSALPLVAETMSGRKIDMDAAIGNIVSLQTGESLRFPEWHGNPPDVDKQLDFLLARVQQSGFSEFMFGSGASTESGYALSQQADQGRIRLEQPISHLEQMWSSWAKKVLSLTTTFAEDKDIYVYGQTRGDMFDDYLDVQDLSGIKVMCSIKPEYPNEKTRKHAMSTQAAGHVSETTLMEQYFDIPQPDDEFQRMLVELAPKDPIMVKYNLMAEIRDRAIKEQDPVAVMVWAEMEKQLTQTLMGGGNTTQQGPNAPISGAGGLTGTQSVSGEAPLQATTLGAPGKNEGDVVMRGTA